MSGYRPPVADMMAALTTAADLDRLTRLPAFAECDAALIESVLNEAARLAAEEIAPLDRGFDTQGVRLENGAVFTPPGMKEAYARYVAGGWNGLAADPAHGGQGLPHVVGMAVQEMWHGASMAFGLCPLLNQGAIEALRVHGAEAQKRTYLPKLVSGVWTGTMNLTEPQAGSDLGAIECRAWRDGEAYRLKGQKIYISFGEHDLAENIVHLVLARIDGAPAGSKGLSLFIVPKFLPAADGSPGPRNDLRCVSMEHKLGLHASPTCTMAFGDNEGATAFLVGPEHGGLACMFTMMNHARINVGLEGVGVAERAFQRARAHAAERVQGRALGEDAAGPIDRHPDVRRMLAGMHARTEAARLLAYAAGAQLDLARHGEDEETRASAHARADLLTPLAKAWCTDIAAEVACAGIQTHGGMGFIEETGAAQHWRDVRVTRIYEGTNGIQAGDLAFRKVGRDGGAAALRLLSEMEGAVPTPALEALKRATAWMIDAAQNRPKDAAAVAVPYQELFALVVAGALLNRSADILARDAAETPPARRKAAAARFFNGDMLTAAPGLAETVLGGAESQSLYDSGLF